ncbi:ABC transporter permease subunit [Blautia sp. RD014234]|nr:ABC transporter permease subunit [Blautia parvula]
MLEFPFAIILALMLNEIRNMKFKKVTQTITYLPHFLSSVIIVTMLQRILAPDTGILNQLIAGMGGDGGTFFMMDAKYFLKILFSMDLWRNIGWDSIIYLAAISSVDTALYEAAEMDGCGKLKKCGILHCRESGEPSACCSLWASEVCSPRAWTRSGFCVHRAI